jgi:hypothetical protein
MINKFMNKKMMPINNFKECRQFENCSAPVCPIDPDARFCKKLLGENPCPFTINKKTKEQKGIRTLSPIRVLKVIPISNLKLLNKRNQKRWHNAQQPSNT